MARSEIMRKIEALSEERERLLAREGSHHAGAGDHRRLEDIDHSLGVLLDLRRRELAGEYVGLDEDFLDPATMSSTASPTPRCTCWRLASWVSGRVLRHVASWRGVKG